ncbi:MAG: FHA domain-containing protein [Polyangiales bacterium]
MTSRGEARRGAPRFRVRYRGTWYELPPGDFFIGRSPGCQLTFEDPRVSRKHACFRVEAHRVTVEDLRSRNGTLVNGVLLRGPQVLTHDDLVTIGSQELRMATVLDADSVARDGSSTDPEGGLEEATQTGGLPPLLTQLDKALRAGSHEETDRILALLYGEFDADARRARPPTPSPAVVEGVTRITLAHAAITQRGAWVDRLFALYHRHRQVMPTALVEEVAVLLRRFRHPLSPELREYAEWVRGEADRLGPADRFAQQRLEGLVLALRGQPEG